ncbi:MAG TPA: serine hydrolase domain-containing protein [Myxococcota bacterium]|nr:serine hydrolase domain-containing protein [Myxococcota bacterium]
MLDAAERALPIEGDCDPRFAAVRDAFAANFRDEGDLGSAVCAIVDGRTVVDLWGGFVDAEASRPWRRDTLVNAFSVGKGILALLALACVEAGELALDAPVASLWPEFAAEGKDRLTVRALLAHRAGLPALRTPLEPDELYDWDLVCARLAAQRPWWEPDLAHGYHVNTWGFLVGEVLRRATGRPVGALLRERLAAPLDADYHWGLAAADHPRVSPSHLPELPLDADLVAMVGAARGDAEHETMIRHAYFNPRGISGFGTVNTAAWRKAVIPSTNGLGSARGIARVYQALASSGGAGGVAVSAALRAEAARVHSDGDDRVLGRPSRFGLGFQLGRPGKPFGPSAHAFGHHGYGGSLGLVDPEAGLAFGYVTNRPAVRFRTARTDRILQALYAAL